MEKGWEWREQREGSDMGSMGHVLGIRKGPAWQVCMRRIKATKVIRAVHKGLGMPG